MSEADGDQLSACLRARYNLHPTDIMHLARGADPHTTVYRVEAAGAQVYFLKLRTDFDPTSVTVPHFLATQGVPHLIAPIPCVDGRLYTQFGATALILYPFVAGSDGFALALADRHWVQLGAALRRIHTATLPAVLAAVPREDFSPRWREQVRAFFNSSHRWQQDIQQALHTFLHAHRTAILDLVAQAERLAAVAQTATEPYVLCHGDIHGGNVLLGIDGELFIVDWDTVTIAPKERDLMFVGAGVAGVWNQPHEADLFYAGYGPCIIDERVLAYYRCERIVQDIAVTCTQLLGGASSSAGGELGDLPSNDDRAAILQDLTAQFEPNNVVAIAWRTLQRLAAGTSAAGA